MVKIMDNLTSQRLIALGIVLFLLLNFPFLKILLAKGTIFHIPAIVFIIFLVWIVAIGTFYAIIRLKPEEKAGNEQD